MPRRADLATRDAYKKKKKPTPHKRPGRPARIPTDRQRVFAAEYVSDFNGARAARAAGYSSRNAARLAQQMLASETVIKLVRDLLDQRAKEVAVTRKFLESEALSALRAAKEDKSHSAVRGLIELLAKMSGNLVERREVREIKDWADLTEAELAALAAMDSAPAPSSTH